MKKHKDKLPKPLSKKIIYLIISIVAFAIYANTLNHGFVLDDIAVIENNNIVKKGISGIPELFTTFYWEGYWSANAGLYRPMSLVMFAIEYTLFPNSPFVHHFMNVLLYIVCSCLLFNVLSNWFKNINPSFFLLVSLIFVVHPLHTEVVANIKSRDEILALLFGLLCCHYLYKHDIDKTLKTTILCSLLFLFSLLSKEGAIVFLAIIFLIDYVREKNIFKILFNRIHLIITTAAWLVWHQYIIHSNNSPVINYTYNDNSLLSAATVLEQKATAFGIFARYILKLIYPYELSYDYSFNQIEIITFFSPLALIGLLLFAGLIFCIIKFRNKEPLISLAAAFILFPLLLTGNLIFNIGATMGDRFLFVSVIGSSIGICWVVFKMFNLKVMGSTKFEKAFYLIIPLLVLFSVKTFARNKDWESNKTLFIKDVETVPNSARAQFNYGTVMMNYTDAKSSLVAQKAFDKCLAIDPNYADAWINYGAIFFKQKEYKEALNKYKKALPLKKNDAVLYGNIGETYFRINELDSAVLYLQKGADLGNKKSELFDILGTSWFLKNDYSKACLAFEKGLNINPNNASIYMNYGNALAMTNRDVEAIAALKKAYQLNQDNKQALYFIAITYNKMGDTLNANSYYQQFQHFNGKKN